MAFVLLGGLAVSAPLFAEATPSPKVPQAATIPVTGSPVANLFIHPLLAFPKLAFTPGKDESRMDEWFVTTSEFYKVLESLEGRGYILVKASEVYVQDGEGWKIQVPAVPEGRRPLVLSMDDVNYYPYMRKNGTVSRLVVDAKGRLLARTFLPKGGFRDDTDLEAPQVLEAFLVEHPDFSFHGARGLIGVTGYAGVFGWPTQKVSAPDAATATAEAKKVADALKAMGWEFATHSYAHQSSRSQSYDAWAASEARWKAEVEPVVGPTPFYILPFGEAWWRDDQRWKAMREAGFRVFFGVEKVSNLRMKDGLPIPGRVPLDGRGLRRKFGLLSPFMDVPSVWDPLRPATMTYQ